MNKLKFSGDLGVGGGGGAAKDSGRFEPKSFTYSGSETITQYAAVTLMHARRFLTDRRGLSLNPLVGRKVTLVLAPLAGFGDILFVYKECLALKAQGFKVSIAIIACGLRTSLEVKEQLLNMPDMKDVRIVTSEDEEKRALKPDCVLIGPTAPSYGIALDLFPDLSGVPSEVIYEYGGNNTAEENFNPFSNPLSMNGGDLYNNPSYLSIKAGIGPGELGIFIENGLISPLSKEEKVKELDLLKEEHPEKLSLILGDRSGEEYLHSTNLFFGYAHKKISMERFIHTVILSQQLAGCKKNIDIVIPWELTLGNSFKHYTRELEDTGIKKLEIITVEESHIELISDDASLKVLRIINIFPISNTLMRDLLAVSEVPVLITGDQSWNEAMLLEDKMILYEKMDWKTDLYKSIMEKASPYPLVKNLMESWDPMYGKTPEDIAKAIITLQQDSLIGEGNKKPQLRAFHESIVNERYCLEKSIVGEALRLSAIGKIPEFKIENELMEKKIGDVFNIPIFIEECSKLLRFILASPERVIPKKDMQIIIVFMNKYNNICNIYETDKTILSEEVMDSIEMGIRMVCEIAANKKINNKERVKILDSLLKLPKLLVPIVQKKLKDVF